jgi:predicted amidophosphoribosyltransferase
VWRALLDLLFPAQCAACNALGSGLCNACTPRRERIEVRFPGLRVRAYGAYDGYLRAAILALKDGRRDVAEALGRTVAPLIASSETLVPIPSSARRRRVRGLDGVAVVARRAAEIAGARVVTALTQCSSRPQHGRTRAQRLAAAGRFVCGDEVTARRIVLFDDVCTTGATLRDAAAAVRAAGGLVEHAVVLAVTKSEPSWRMPSVS